MLQSLGIAVLSIAITVAAGGDAEPDQLSAGDLYGFCTDISFAPGQAACRFYILGIAQGMSVSINADGRAESSKHFCLPDNVPSEEMRLVFVRLAGADFAAYPDDRKLMASGLVGGIMLKQYPCR